MIKKLSFLFVLFGLVTISLSSTYALNQNDNRVDINMDGGFVQRDLFTKLEHEAKPESITFFGDSTGDQPTEWIYLTSSWLKDQITSHNVVYRLWNDTTQNYGTPTFLTADPEIGGYVEFNDVAGDMVRTPDSEQLSLTGDLEFIVRASTDDVTSTGTFINKFGAVGQYSYGYYVQNGTLKLWLSPDGTTQSIYSSTVTVPFRENNLPYWSRVTLDVDDGAGNHVVTFYYSLDGINWVLLGDPVVTVGTTTIHDSTYRLELGSFGNTSRLAGKLYNVIIKNEIGKVVLNADFGNVPSPDVLTYTDTENNVFELAGSSIWGLGDPTLTIYNGSKGSTTTTYFSDPVRFEKLYPHDSIITVLNLSHNEGAITNYTTYVSLINQILSANSTTDMFLSTQNEQKNPPNIFIEEHTIRNNYIRWLALKEGYGLIDGYNAVSYENITDGTHPNETGSIEWSLEAQNTFTDYLFKDTEYYIYASTGSLITNYVQPIKNGYDYLGLYTTSSFVTEFDLTTDTIVSGTTLYVQWESDLQPMINLLPLIFGIILLAGVILYIKFDTSSGSVQKIITVFLIIVIGVVLIAIIQGLV